MLGHPVLFEKDDDGLRGAHAYKVEDGRVLLAIETILNVFVRVGERDPVNHTAGAVFRGRLVGVVVGCV